MSTPAPSIAQHASTHYPDRPAHELVREVAQRHPDATALRFAGENICFAQLETQVTRLIERLREHGAQHGTRIAVCLPPTPEAIVTLLAVLRLEAVFVPFDPHHPVQRHRQLLEDSRAPLAIAAGTPDTGDPAIAATGLAPPDLPTDPFSLDSPACILYTSGSTGQPKGVVRTHRGIVSRLAWNRILPDDVFCHNMSLCYGFSQERALLPLMAGQPLVILPEPCHSDAAALIEAVEHYGITRLTSVPALLAQLVDPQRPLHRRLASLRTVTVGSAPVPTAVVEQFARALPHAALLNVYGATESGTITSCELRPNSPVTAGRPIANMELHILDDVLRPVPDGEVGEVCAAGPSLARGYLNEPKLTADRFIVNRYGSHPVLYRTGDRGRILPDGRLELAGRVDRQVKVRGYRVELAEIETILAELPEVQEVAVCGQPIGHRSSTDPGDDHRLIAYVCAQPGTPITVSRLRRHLQTRVPTHMLPSAYVFLDALPRTALGKIDASALPAPGTSRPHTGIAYAPPRTPLEDHIASIWAEVLELDCVGRDDDFFDLGGDSLVAVRISVTIEERLGIAIRAVSLFENSTIAELADAILHEVPPGR